MLPKYIIFAFMFFFQIANGQDSIVQFSDVIRKNIKPYIRKADAAYAQKDYKQGEVLFDSMVNRKLKNSTFDDLNIKNYNSTKGISTNEIKKKIILITYASWYIMDDKEIEILNKSAKENFDSLEIILLFWDKKENLKKIVSKFDKKIQICYAHETYNNDLGTIALLKHTFGFPTSISIDENKKVQNISHLKNALSLNEIIPNLLAQKQGFKVDK